MNRTLKQDIIDQILDIRIKVNDIYYNYVKHLRKGFCPTTNLEDDIKTISGKLDNLQDQIFQE